MVFFFGQKVKRGKHKVLCKLINQRVTFCRQLTQNVHYSTQNTNHLSLKAKGESPSMPAFGKQFNESVQNTGNQNCQSETIA